MSETNAQPVFNIQRIYLKDASLEIPNAPHIFLEADTPSVEVQLDVAEASVFEGIFEVVVTVTVTTRVKDQIAFLVEAKQAGIFEIRNVPPENVAQILGIMCPNIVYPYLRASVADLINRTGFPPIHLQEINFEAFFQQRQAALAQQQAGGLVGTDGQSLQ